jgi:hypothetical protein
MVTTIECVYKGMATAEINILTLVEIKIKTALSDVAVL